MAYSLVVVNNGPSDAANLTVTDALPAGVTFVSATGTGWVCTNAGNVSVTCTRPALAAGALAPTITVTVTAPAQAGSLSDTASVASPTSDPDPANNTSTVVTAVTASADLAITKTGPATVLAGGAVAYSLVVVNNGPSDAAALTVSDPLPVGVTFVSATGAGWTCTNVGNVSVDLHPPGTGDRRHRAHDHRGGDRARPGGEPVEHRVGDGHDRRPRPGEQHLDRSHCGDGVRRPGDRQDRPGDRRGRGHGRRTSCRSTTSGPRTRPASP